MNTLTGIEAERVNQILKNSKDQLNILSYVPSVWDEELINRMTCQPVINSIGKTWVSEEQLSNLGEGGPSDVGGGRDIQLIKQAHRVNRATCRNLMADRESLQILMDYKPESGSGDGEGGGHCSEEYQRFTRYLTELKDQIHAKMITTVEDEAANRTLLHDLTERERLMEETRDALQNKLNEVRSEKEHVTFSLDQTTRKTQVELQDIKQSNSRDLETVQREMSEAITKATNDHDSRMRQLQDHVGGLERTVVETIERNRDEEMRLRKEKGRVENTLNAKISQYDADMEAKAAALADLKATLEAENAEYAQLREHFDKVDADKKYQAEEDEVLDAARRRRAFGDAMVNRFVVRCQAAFRGHLGRVAVNKLKPKGKGGKKKK
eukprot:GSChrysophyteH1.ASY1.ANO1.1302.1 assembled CDS